jgi:hypothetical protein
MFLISAATGAVFIFESGGHGLETLYWRAGILTLSLPLVLL